MKEIKISDKQKTGVMVVLLAASVALNIFLYQDKEVEYADVHPQQRYRQLPDSLPPLPENLTAEQRGKIESAFKKAKRKELEFMCREFIEKK